MCGCKRHNNDKAACTCSCGSCLLSPCYRDHVPTDGQWIFIRNDVESLVYTDGEGTCYTLTQSGAVELSERLGSIARAAVVARLRATAEVIDRNAPCETAGVR